MKDIESLRILNDNDKKKLVSKIESLISEIDEHLVIYSSAKAEAYHHEECKYKCCGEHDGVFTDKINKCKVCGMTEELQEKHNDLVWQNIDYVEGNDHCQEYRDKVFTPLNEVIKYLGGMEAFHH